MLIPIPYVQCAMGIAVALVSVPLMLRKVPMNHLYGVRVKQAFVSERNWYAINVYGGWLLFLFGVFLAAFGWLARAFAPPPQSLWAPLFLVVPLLPLIPVIWLINLRARRLPSH